MRSHRGLEESEKAREDVLTRGRLAQVRDHVSIIPVWSSPNRLEESDKVVMCPPHVVRTVRTG